PDGILWDVRKDAPEIKALLGVLEAGEVVGHPSLLTAIVREGDDWFFASMSEDMQWKTGAAVPEAFPVAGFGNVSYEQMYYPYLTLVAGKDRRGRLSNLSWSTMDGLAWVRLTDENKSFYEEREGVMLTQYDGKLFLIGGIDASNHAQKDIYRSENKGVTWNLADTLIVLPEDCRARGYASVLVDEENFLLLFGGKESNGANMLEELWRGRINRLGFVE
ncbi:MAG: exo-alpha-sialidase, partial [Tannerella sp.]|nr:exo-alpha-sialidase [Tannerella sp.]